MSSTSFERVKIDKLKNHRLNAQVFGEISSSKEDTEFVASIKSRGILQPLIVTADFTVISGHRRRQGAGRAGLLEVPCIVRRDLVDQADIDRAWFDANRNREMTIEQKARWFKVLEKIESDKAEKRQKTGKSDLASNLTQGRKLEASTVAAKEVGMSRNTAKAAAAVVDVIDKKEKAGDTETAEKLRQTLNTKSVRAARKEADRVSGKPEPEKPAKVKNGAEKSPAKLIDKLTREHISPLVKGLDSVARIIGERGPNYETADNHLNGLIGAFKELKGGKA